MRKPQRIHQILLLVFMMLQITLIAMAQQPSTEVPTLELGKSIERELAASDAHSYQVTLAAGQFLRAVVEQRGIDVVVTVFAPDGQKLAEIDSPNGTQGPEPITIEAQAAGVYRLEIRSLEKEAQPGRYEAKIEELLTAEEHAKRLEAERAKTETARNWLVKNAIPLHTVEAGNGFADLQPLKKLIGKARLVSLGEATHGTREFFQLKHRMLEFLVSEMGFTIFGIEATMPKAFDINEYVLTVKGDSIKALAGLYFWTWDTEEVLEMIRWMRRYNEDPRNMADRPITRSEWREYEIVGDVPAEAQTISYGFALVGDGHAWIDAVAVEVIDK